MSRTTTADKELLRSPSQPDACRWMCLTPTRNESWIIERFLAAAKLWATDIVVADQGSTDGTLQTLQGIGVQLVLNDSPRYDEQQRQKLLLSQARKTPGKRILIGLDADEALSANVAQSSEWARVADAPPGTVLRFRWVNILPGFTQAWIPPQFVAFGFVDDGSEHDGRRIHSPRVPQPPGAPVIDLQEIVVLHFQYVAWDRMISKHRWYQVWEHLEHREKRPLEIFRQYHHMYGGWDSEELHPVKPEWLEGYDQAGIDFRSLKSEPVTWWDKEVLRLLRDRGPEHFRKLAIWDKDWNSLARATATEGGDLSDPRSVCEKVIHRLLKATQSNRQWLTVRALERSLRAVGW